ncbi:MAG: hypothetical protein U0271_39365 [Polyangiaceae bacterium]
MTTHLNVPFFRQALRLQLTYKTQGNICKEELSPSLRVLVLDDFGLLGDSPKSLDPATFERVRAGVALDSADRVRAWAAVEWLVQFLASRGGFEHRHVAIDVMNASRDLLAIDRDRELGGERGVLRAALVAKCGWEREPYGLLVLGFPLTFGPDDARVLDYCSTVGAAFLAHTFAGLKGVPKEEEELWDLLDGAGLASWHEVRGRRGALSAAVAMHPFRVGGDWTSGAIALAALAGARQIALGSPAHMVGEAPFTCDDWEVVMTPRAAREAASHGLLAFSAESTLGLWHGATVAAGSALGPGLLTFQFARAAHSMMFLCPKMAAEDVRTIVDDWLQAYVADVHSSRIRDVVRSRRPFRRASFHIEEGWPAGYWQLQLQLHEQAESTLSWTRARGFGDGTVSPPIEL